MRSAASAPDASYRLAPDDLVRALAALSTVRDGTPLTAVSLGTPHFSLAEFERLMPLLEDSCRRPASTSTSTPAATSWPRSRRAAGSRASRDAGITLVVDTCTYVTAIMRDLDGAVMTNSGKWAHYAPGNIGVDVAFGSLADCIASAARGRVTRRAPMIFNGDFPRCRRGRGAVLALAPL